MADEKKNENLPPKTIAVRTLRFLSTAAPNIELYGSAKNGSAVTAKDPGESKLEHYAIDFIPAIRHHRVQWFQAGHDGKAPPTRTSYVYEGHVATWEPLS